MPGIFRSTAIGALRKGTHLVNVKVGTPGHLVVTVDGKRVLNTAARIPANSTAI